MHGLKTKLSKINRSFQSRRSFTHRRITFGTLQSQPSTISHQLSTARKELSSKELREERPAPRLELDRLSADYQHIASRALVNAKCATFLQNSRHNPACHAVASPRRLVKPTFCSFSTGARPQPHPGMRLSKIQATRRRIRRSRKARWKRRA